VCCTVDISAKARCCIADQTKCRSISRTLNSFLAAAYDEPHADCFLLVVVKSMKEIYTDVIYPPVHEGVFDSPFKELPELECYHTLYKIYQDTRSELNYWWFVVMDEQSTVEDTVMLCAWDGAEDLVHTMRVGFRLGNMKLCALSTGHQGFKDTGE
jgi:hypothetical protein